MTVKSRLLELLEQHKGETLSGEDIGRELSCTRAAVWKAVNSLRSFLDPNQQPSQKKGSPQYRKFLA